MRTIRYSVPEAFIKQREERRENTTRADGARSNTAWTSTQNFMSTIPKAHGVQRR